MGENDEELISQLKKLREDIKIINTIFHNLNQYKEYIASIDNSINAILYTITGDAFYKQ